MFVTEVKKSPIIEQCPSVPLAHFYRQHMVRAKSFSDILLETLTLTL